MTDHDVHGCGRIGSRIGVLCAGLGVAVAVVMVVLMDMSGFLAPSALLGPLGIGLLALFLASAILGKYVGTFLCKRGNNALLAVAGGFFLAFSSIVIAVFTGSAFTFLITTFLTTERVDLETLFILPQILVGLFGGIPAIILGFVYGLLVRRQLAKAVIG
jgi:hypothetical protein